MPNYYWHGHVRHVDFYVSVVVGDDVINIFRPSQDARHFQDIFKWIFLNENARILIKISLKFILYGPINKHYSSIVTDNGLALDRQPAIIWTNDG